MPISKTGSKVFNLRISGCRRLIGTPLTLISPAPFFTNATAVAVFYTWMFKWWYLSLVWCFESLRWYHFYQDCNYDIAPFQFNQPCGRSTERSLEPWQLHSWFQSVNWLMLWYTAASVLEALSINHLILYMAGGELDIMLWVFTHTAPNMLDDHKN